MPYNILVLWARILYLQSFGFFCIHCFWRQLFYTEIYFELYNNLIIRLYIDFRSLWLFFENKQKRNLWIHYVKKKLQFDNNRNFFDDWIFFNSCSVFFHDVCFLKRDSTYRKKYIFEWIYKNYCWFYSDVCDFILFTCIFYNNRQSSL